MEKISHIQKNKALTNYDSKIVSNIATDLGISDEKVEDVVLTFFYGLRESMKRGVNFDLGILQGSVKTDFFRVLRKKRIGDQKEIIDCIRWGGKISERRMQTILLINKLKKQNGTERND